MSSFFALFSLPWTNQRSTNKLFASNLKNLWIFYAFPLAVVKVGIECWHMPRFRVDNMCQHSGTHLNFTYQWVGSGVLVVESILGANRMTLVNIHSRSFYFFTLTDLAVIPFVQDRYRWQYDSTQCMDTCHQQQYAILLVRQYLTPPLSMCACRNPS